MPREEVLDDDEGGAAIPASSMGSKLRCGLTEEYSSLDGDLPVIESKLSIADCVKSLSIGDECLNRTTTGCSGVDRVFVFVAKLSKSAFDSDAFCKELERREANPMFDCLLALSAADASLQPDA